MDTQTITDTTPWALPRPGGLTKPQARQCNGCRHIERQDDSVGWCPRVHHYRHMSIDRVWCVSFTGNKSGDRK